MQRTSIAQPELTFDDEDPPGFRAGLYRMGPGLGARRTGASLYELPPGEALCPYHYEASEEEWLLVVGGRPSVRHPHGTDLLEPDDVVFFPPGPDGAHQVRNDGEEPARVLMWSQVAEPAVSVYPDSDKVGVWTGREEEEGLFLRSSRVPYYEGEEGFRGAP